MKIEKTKNKFFQFGEEIPGYDTTVLNERDIRAAAGIMFLVMFIAFVFVFFEQDFLLIKYVIIAFFTDFFIRVLINPMFSPTLILGRLIVSNQVPEYVSAPQKKFAWSIGLVLSGLMFFLLVVLNSYSMLTGFTCVVCLVFLFFETAFGICVGCIFYRWFHKNEALHCPGESCARNKKHITQKITPVQLLSLFSYIFLIVLTVLLFNGFFHDKPKDLQEIIKEL